jgi:hypothetical protein
MQINIKDVRHVIEILTTDDAHLIAEEFVQEHKLKPNSLTRIELELLRTQLDTCHHHQAKLRQYISYLRRLAVCSSDLESRVLSLEYQNHDMILTFHRFKHTILPQTEALWKEKKMKMMRLEKRNESLLRMVRQMLETLREKLQTEKSLTFHCFELEEKLRRAVEVISNPLVMGDGVGEAKMDPPSRLARNLDQDFGSDSEEKSLSLKSRQSGQVECMRTSSIGTMTDSSLTPVVPAPTPAPVAASPGTDSTSIEKLATETSETLTTAMEALMAEYERRMAVYEDQHRADQETIRLHQTTEEKTTAVVKSAENTLLLVLEEKDKEIEHLHEVMNQLREQNKTLQVTSSNLKVSLQQAQAKNELLTIQTQNISKRSQEQEEETQEIRGQLVELTKSTQLSTNRKLEDENRSLNEQVVTLRGEVIRLQSEIHEIQEKAIQAVHVVQLLDKDPSSSSASPQMGSKKLSSSRALVARSHSMTQPSIPHISSSSSAHQALSHSSADHHDPPEHEIYDGEVTVELSLEGDETGGSVGDDSTAAVATLPEAEEVYTEAEVDLMLQHSLVNLKLEEKSIASLSPVVEDRLLRNIYHKYALETTGSLTLSRSQARSPSASVALTASQIRSLHKRI